MLDGLSNYLQQFFWWCLASVLSVVDSVLGLVVAVWPKSWAAPVGEAYHYMQQINAWVPLQECIILTGVWCTVAGIFFVVKVVLYLF